MGDGWIVAEFAIVVLFGYHGGIFAKIKDLIGFGLAQWSTVQPSLIIPHLDAQVMYKYWRTPPPPPPITISLYGNKTLGRSTGDEDNYKLIKQTENKKIHLFHQKWRRIIKRDQPSGSHAHCK